MPEVVIWETKVMESGEARQVQEKGNGFLFPFSILPVVAAVAGVVVVVVVVE